MSDQNTPVNAYALHDILLGIAESLTEAERQLRNQPPYDAFGRPNTIYQLPYLDFNLQVTTEFEEITSGDSTPTSGSTSEALPEYQRRIKWSPAPRQSTTPSGNTTTTNRSEIYSSVSGRFVATVPNEGLPQVIISTARTAIDDSDSNAPKFTITATVSNAANELLPNSTVEFNYDEERTIALNPDITFNGVPTFSNGEVISNSDAQATVEVTLDASDYALTPEVIFVFILNVGPVTRLVSISNKS